MSPLTRHRAVDIATDVLRDRQPEEIAEIPVGALRVLRDVAVLAERLAASMPGGAVYYPNNATTIFSADGAPLITVRNERKGIAARRAILTIAQIAEVHGA